MPVFRLSAKHTFPPVSLAEPDGVLAVGGDLSVGRLLAAYRAGIFPWYSKGYPILWWAPDPRFVLFPDRLRVSDSLRRVLKKGGFSVTFDKAFGAVIAACGKIKRRRQRGTWITEDMIEAYRRLHEAGYAHSVETWFQGGLVGGLYGVSLGRAFFGESMFARVSDASKVALVTLVDRLKAQGLTMIDCQVHTPHMESLGAVEVPRDDFMDLLREALQGETVRGDWGRASEMDRERNTLSSV
jgi:leucyl/phenylalanyl-tRNA---protein transferase